MYCKFNWTAEIKEFILENYKGVGPSEMADIVSDIFDVSCTRSLMKNFYGRNHLNSGVTGYFEIGHTPLNKGKKQSEYMSHEAIERTKATRFKQSGLPHNTKPIGYERINADGYIEVKVRMRPDRVNHKRNFVAKHILVWEEHNGPVPEGMIVRFLDGNKLNCSIDNLVLMTRAEHLQLTRSKHYSDNPEITKTGVALAKLNIAITNQKDKK